MLPHPNPGQILIEEALRESKAIDQELADSMADVFFELDRDLHYTYWNKASEKLTGISAKHALGKSLFDILPDSSGTRSAVSLCRAVLKIRQPRSLVSRHQIAGKELYFEIHAYPSENGVAVIFRDITERKNAEAALLKNEARFRSLFNSMTEGFALHEIICDEKGAPVDYRFLDVNPSFERMTGLQREAVVGRTMLEVLPDDDPQWIRIYGQVALTGRSVHFENRSLALKRHYDVFAYCPAPRQFAVVFTDITKRKLVEEALQESEARYHGLFESIASGVIMQDQAGAIVEVNTAACEILGLTQEELLGRATPGPGWQFMREDGTPFAGEDCPALSALRTGQALHNVVVGVLHPKLGSRRWILFNSEPILDAAGGQVKAVVTSFADITARKQAEEILRRDKDMIEAMAERRSKELIETRIELEKAKHLSDIGALAAVIAHELRNPLSAISLAAANIKKKANSELAEKHLLTIEKKITESVQIINNLLFYSRIRPPIRESLVLADIVEECLESAQKQFRKTISVVKELEPIGGVILSLDPVQMKEVFLNLLNNAHDAVPDQHGIIRVSGCESGEFINIHFQDNGEGINSENINKIFEPFFTTKPRGTGLGLTVCQQILDMHGGLIRIGSRAGQGALITVSLPKSS